MTDDVIYEVKDLHRDFPVRGGVLRRTVAHVKAVGGVSLSVERGKTFGILGESGSGKSTVARIMALIDKPTSGSLHFRTADGESHQLDRLSGSRRQELQRRVQMVFQDPYAVFNPRQRVIDSFQDVLKAYGVRTSNERRDRILEALDYVSMRPEYLNRYPHELSGGQRQRLSIARALSPRPDVLICDESVSALDVSVQAQVLNLLRSIQRETGITYVFIAHDLSVVRYMSDSVAVMYLGQVMEVLDSDTMHLDARHPYTKALIEAVPSADVDRPSSGRPLTGDIPSPINRPPGCPFATRCPVRVDICDVQKPSLLPVINRPQQVVACHVVHASTKVPS